MSRLNWSGADVTSAIDFHSADKIFVIKTMKLESSFGNTNYSSLAEKNGTLTAKSNLMLKNEIFDFELSMKLKYIMGKCSNLPIT